MENSSIDNNLVKNENDDESSGLSSSSYDSLDKYKYKRIHKELQHLAFVNPGRLTWTAGFNPDNSNREKRKLSRLVERQHNKTHLRKPAVKPKQKRKALHDAIGCLEADGRDVCDCHEPDCPGCHYPCPNCNSEKCGSTCRCHRRWSYDHVDIYYERTFTK
eukprot:gene9890-10902_t